MKLDKTEFHNKANFHYDVYWFIEHVEKYEHYN